MTALPMILMIYILTIFPRLYLIILILLFINFNLEDNIQAESAQLLIFLPNFK